MSKYIGSDCRLCRAEGQKLFLKGIRCFSGKCSVLRKPNSPGQHGGQSRKKVSEYGHQLRAKQKARRYYGVLEKQFKHYYNLAIKIKEGKTGENMLSIMESRLDSIVYYLGWSHSRAHARQLISHKFFDVNGKNVNIPSFLTKAEDKISISSRGKKSKILNEIINESATRTIPKWIEFVNAEHFEAKVLNKAERSDIGLEVDETLIVELFSK